MPTLTIDIEARLAKFQDSLNQIGRQGEEMARRFDGAFSGLRNTLAGLGASLSAGAFAAFVKSGIDAADELNKLSQKVGVTVESLSALQYAAKLSDVSTEQLSTGLARLARAASDAASGSKEPAEAFAALNIAVKDSQGQLRSTEQLLLDIAEKFAGMEDGAGKTALAMRLFGRAGADLIPFLNLGRAGFEELRKEAERLGIVISGETAKAAEEFNDNMTRLGQQVDKAKIALVGGLIEPLGRVAKAMADAAKEGGAFKSVIAGIQTLLTGDDLHKANVELTQLTDELMSTEAEIARKAGKATAEELKALEEHLDRVKARLGEVQRYRSYLLGETDIFGDPKLKTETKKLPAPTLPDTAAAERAKREAEQRERALGAFNRARDLDAAAAKALEDKFAKQARDEAAAEARRLDALRQSIVDVIEPANMWIRKMADVEELQRAGKLSAEEFAEAMEYLSQKAQEATLETDKYGKAAKEVDDVARELGLTFQSAFEDAIIEGKKFSDVLKAIAQDAARIFLRKSVTEPLAGAAGKALEGFDFGKVFDPIITGLKNLTTFAEGGSFMVGGGGGTDSQLVAFHASPDERVTIETPEQQRRGGGVVIHQSINIDARGADPGVEQRLRAWGREIMAQTLQAVQAQADRGGSFARAVGRR